MEYRTLGKTDLEVSIISFGAAPLGSEYRKTDESEGISAVHTALDLGVNFIDTSPYYGRTESEIVLGKALGTVNRNQYYLATLSKIIMRLLFFILLTSSLFSQSFCPTDNQIMSRSIYSIGDTLSIEDQNMIFPVCNGSGDYLTGASFSF